MKAYCHVIDGNRTYPNLNLRIKKLDIEDTTMDIDMRSLKIINTVFPYIEDLTINISRNEYAGSLTKSLNKFKKLKNLTIKVGPLLKFKGPLLKLKHLKITTSFCDEDTVASILERMIKYNTLTLEKCLVNKKILSILKYENIQNLKIRNIDCWEINDYRTCLSFIKNCRLKKIELVSTFRNGSMEELIKKYLENHIQKDIEEITFSIVEDLNLDNFLRLRKLKKITIYYSIFIYPDIELIIAPLLIQFPNVKFELREFLITKLFKTHHLISIGEYQDIQEYHLNKFEELHSNFNLSYTKDPFLVMTNEDKKYSDSIPFPFPRKTNRKRSISTNSDSTIPTEEYQERLNEISDSSENE